MKVYMRNEPAPMEMKSLTAKTDTPIEFDQKDDQVVLAIAGTAGTTITIKAGNGLQGVNDEVITLSSELTLIKLESGRFKNVSGENKGKIVLNASAAASYGIAALI